jgi:prepilin signal peptidase PulO-like enzyme (type II secretory pathway)
VPDPIAAVLAAAGASWGLASDRIAARWPAHEDGHVRRIDWRTAVVVLAGALACGAIPARFVDPVPAVIFGAYAAALVFLLATDLDQRLLTNVITLPAIPAALMIDAAGFNPLVPIGELPLAIIAAIAIPVLFAVLALPFGAGAIGEGDLKLLVSAGLMAGAARIVSGVVWGVVLAGVVIVVLLVLRRVTLRTFIPYGPFLIAGALWAILGVS